MILRLPAILLALIALVIAPACSSKSKQAKTTPTAKDTSGATQKVAEVPRKTQDNALGTKRLGPDVALTTVYFEFDSAVLSAAARDHLDANAKWLQENPGKHLVIEGHTDEAGTNEYNMALGQARAQAAYEYLVRLGVDPGRLSVTTYGEERPATPGTDELNRRSEFVPEKN